MGNWLEESPVLLEFVPPALRLGEAGLEKRLAWLGALLARFPFSAVNIPEIREEESRSADGQRTSPFEPRFSPRHIAREIDHRFKVPVIVNHVVAEQRREELGPWILESHEVYGIEHFVLVGPSSGHREPIGPTVTEANAIVRETLPGVRIGNICIPGRLARGIEEHDRMEAKAASGVDFFTSQIVYHAAPFVALLDALASSSPHARQTPLLLSLCPLRSPKSIAFLRWLGVEMEGSIAAHLCQDEERVLERSIEHLIGVWDRIRQHAVAEGIANPLGLNIAPIGPIPARSTVALARALSPHPSG